MPPPIGYFGDPGSFAHQAAQERFPHANLKPCASVEEAFARLQAGAFSQIVAPIENATLGIISDTADELIRLVRKGKSPHAVREMLALSVRLMLLARSRTQKINRIYSHPAALAHARSWLAHKYPKAEIVPTASTSEAAQAVLRASDAAAIAGVQAARHYGLSIVHESVGAELPNQTLFYVIGKPLKDSRARTYTSFVYETKHQPGALVATLLPLAVHGVNLTRIASRPIPGQFDHYWFIVEAGGVPESGPLRKALQDIRRHTNWLATLGSFPMVHLGGKRVVKKSGTAK